jgi:hypothetical protein
MSGGGEIAYNASEHSYTYGILRVFYGQSSYEIANSMDYFDPNPYDPGYNWSSVYLNYCGARDRSQSPMSLDTFNYSATGPGGEVPVGWVNVSYRVSMPGGSQMCY